MRQEIRELALKLWRYHRMNQRLERADALLVLCSYDTSVAERGAQLFLDAWAPLLVFSGGLGAITRNLWSEPEAELFARVARGMGVPAERIVVETRSTNTGENVQFTRRLLAERGLDPESFILVQKPYMERRAYATFRRYWPEKRAVVTSPQFSFEEYLKNHSNGALTEGDVVCIMVGDLQRIRLYPERGFQIPQEIPDEVWAAYEELVAAGYDKHLI
ncbi:MAG TPA: YdcF family protein [Pyrinomonadaceae bacterium]|nr:YdcF family protein [Pyrinomonadaceae bacterium]